MREKCLACAKRKNRLCSQSVKTVIKKTEIILMAACYDALSAKLVESAGFAATFMSGFGVAATRLGLPYTGLISYGEMLDQGRNICHAVSILGSLLLGIWLGLSGNRAVKGVQLKLRFEKN
ncbi:MAG: isocitrate lyase/phosphoenolpyruvate mutase family protein [Deltaproteobacteria bacterium]|nr:isocitrate lyase/phosphoenolpyruvate mutase family protein [Deltaproteobacteria bacterium]